MSTLIPKDARQIGKEIAAYLEEVYGRAHERTTRSNSLPSLQHMVPKFILNLIAAQNPANVTKEKNLLLQEHKMEYHPTTHRLDDFIPTRELISPKNYSVRSEIYNSSIFENEFFTENMFSIIEGDAARLIRSRVAEQYGSNNTREFNPFYFPLPECNSEPSMMKSRAILSTFFTIQLLRAEPRKNALSALSIKSGMSSIDFVGDIHNNLSKAIIETYLRQWTWIRVPNQEMFISELGLVTVPSCFGPTASIMPISRRDFIYIHEISYNHFSLDDKLVCSTSPVIYNWYFDSILQQIFRWEIKQTSSGKHEIGFVANKEAKFSKATFYEPETCCFSCFLNPIRNNPSNKLIRF